MSCESFEGTFSVIILSLDLQETGKKRLFAKQHPYAFSVKTMATAMDKIDYRLEFGGQRLSVVISVKKDAQISTIEKYMNAHLIHAPAARCDGKIGHDLSKLLQLTAKGVAVVEEFCNQFELDHPYRTTLFKSPLNTMKLLNLSRNPITDLIETSDVMGNVIWNRMLGEQPNSWSEKLENDGSPYFHQYLLHPSGNAHSQYYNSSGIRLFKDTKFQIAESDVEYEIDFVVSGRGMWQWIMDCTNVRSSSEAQSIVKLFLEKGFVRRVIDMLCSTITCADDFPPTISRSVIYRIASKGHAICTWFDDLDMDSDGCVLPEWTVGVPPYRSAPRAAVDLGLILDDPGLTMLFEKTVDSNSAVESLKFLLDLAKLRIQFAACCAEKTPDNQKSMMGFWQALNNLIWRYIAVDACLEINISEKKRAEIVELMTFETRIPHREMQAHIAKVLNQLVPVERHMRDLLASFVPSFLRDPQNTQLSNLCNSPEPRVIIQAV